MVCEASKSQGKTRLLSTSTPGKSSTNLHSRCTIKRAVCSKYMRIKRRLFPKLCRICFGDRTKGRLISPCSCSGSVSSIHSDCLKTWILTRSQEKGYSKLYNSNVCEICHSLYNVKMVKKPGSFHQYFKSRRSVQLDLIMSLAFTIVVSLALVLFSSQAEDYMVNDPVTFSGIFVLFTALLILYCLWIYIVVKCHLLRWVLWSYKNPQQKLRRRKENGQLEQVIIS